MLSLSRRWRAISPAKRRCLCDAPLGRYTGDQRSGGVNWRSDPGARPPKVRARILGLKIDSDDVPIYNRDPFRRIGGRCFIFIILLIGLRVQQGGHSRMRASGVGVLMDVHRWTIVRSRSRGGTASEVWRRWMLDPDLHPL